MSSSNTITMVTPNPPRTVVLPNEILRMIFRHTIVFSTVSPLGRPINHTRFIMLYACMVHKLAVVSQQFHEVALAVFYEHNFFDFSSIIPPLRIHHHLLYNTAILPPLRFHHSLRYIRVTLRLTDYFCMDKPVMMPDGTLRDWELFANTVDLFKHCPVARTLRLLSDLNTMQHLRVVRLHIVTAFQDPDASIAIYRAARFCVGARDETSITFADEGLSGAYWRPYLKKSILNGV
jgi:hypothetical protein